MLELLLTLCLSDDHSTCVERWLPRVEGETACKETGAALADDWMEGREDLTLKDWRCVERRALPRLAAEEIAPGVLVHKGAIAEPGPENRGDTANLAAVIGEEAVAVIDAGGGRAIGEAWLAAIRQTTDLPVRWLILTHMHPDHLLGAQPFVEAGATVIGHAKLARAIGSRAQSYRQSYRRLLGPAALLGTVVTAPEKSVEQQRTLDLGGRELVLTAHATAHTDNDLTVYDPETGTLFAGDLVFLEHTPSIDGSITGWIEVLDALVTRDDIERVVPGHGPVVADWPDGARPTLDYLTRLADQTRAAIDRGTPLSEAARTVGADLQGDWALFDVFNPRNATAAYQELEWE